MEEVGGGYEMLALTAASRTAARQRGPAWRRRELRFVLLFFGGGVSVEKKDGGKGVSEFCLWR